MKDGRFKFVPTDEECCINAVQLSKMINEPPSIIRSWVKMYEKYLYIKKINNRVRYTKECVSQFKFIKMLIREKNFTHKQVLDQIINNGFENHFFGSRLDESEITEEDYYNILDILRKQSEIIVNAIRNDMLSEISNSLKVEFRKIVQAKLDAMNKLNEEINNSIDDKFKALEKRLDEKDKELERLYNEKYQKQIDELNNKSYLKRILRQ